MILYAHLKKFPDSKHGYIRECAHKSYTYTLIVPWPSLQSSYVACSVGVLEEKWSYSSVLMVGEFIKLMVSSFMSMADVNSSSSTLDGRTGLTKLWWLLKTSLPMAVPAVVYWLMNLLSYVSIKRVDASTFTVCAQVLQGLLAGAGFGVWQGVIGFRVHSGGVTVLFTNLSCIPFRLVH